MLPCKTAALFRVGVAPHAALLVDHAKSRSRIKRNFRCQSFVAEKTGECCRPWISTSSRWMMRSKDSCR